MVAVSDVDDPKIEEPTDAIIKVTATAICGSDLHLLDHGATMAVKPGDVLGHEPMGVVQDVGSEVTHIKPGDTVVVPFNISCGSCFFCSRQLYSQCDTTRGKLGDRKGASLFGYTHLYGGVDGGQAEYLRVPQAHFGPIKVDLDEVPELGALLLSDVLPTSWQAVEYADIEPGGTVAVYGLGPIGQMAASIALHKGAGRVIGIDRFADRLSMAEKRGAEVVDYSDVDDIADCVREMTGGRGADAVIDAVGMDADGSFADRLFQALKIQPDRFAALHASLASCRRGGNVSVSGVYAMWMLNFPIGDLFDKQISLRWGQANVRRWTDGLYQLLRDGDPLDAAGLVTNVASLDEAPDWYARFKKKEDGVIKVVLRP
jgi:threonine dehydrogenase-like Zn-dependent dehydrogenase